MTYVGAITHLGRQQQQPELSIQNIDQLLYLMAEMQEQQGFKLEEYNSVMCQMLCLNTRSQTELCC
jgi:hypothetical protein